MATEQTQSAPEAAPSTDTATTEAPSFTKETPSSTVESLPQNEGDFADWLSDRLDKFEKGEETPPWEQKQEEEKSEPEAKEEEQKEESADAEDTESSSETEEESQEDSEDEEEVKNMSAAAGAKFKELKAELKDYKARVAEAEKLLEEAKNTATSSEEMESLRSRLAEYEQEIALTRVEATPKFKRAVTEPTQAILDTASSLAERYKIDARRLVNALREESAAEGSDALTDLAADFSERDRVRLYRMADDLSEIARRREYLRENAATAYAEQQEAVKAREAEAEKSYKDNMVKTATSVWSETFAEHPALSALDKEVVEQIRNSGSEADLLDSSPDTRAYAVYAGVAFPHVVKQLTASQAKVAELEKALGKYKKAAPKVSGSTDTSPAVVEDGGFLDAIEQRFSLG